MLSAFTTFHVLISLLGIVSGLVVVYGFVNSKGLDGWNTIFLGTTIATSVTGFMFPFEKLLPSHIVGILSLIILAFAVLARYKYKLEGGWRRTYVITSVIALYFNVFVLVVQSFLKVPSLHEMAPTGSEPPFQLAQGIVLVLFIVLGVMSAKKFRVVQDNRVLR